MRTNRPVAFALLCLVLLIPALAPGEVIRLRDGSSLNGRLIRVDEDSLTFRLSVGPAVRIHRAQIVSIVFDDSAAGLPAAGATRVPAPSGSGTIEVSFKDRELSSKISIEKKKDWDASETANDVIVELIVDGIVSFTEVDTTTDKKIYHGHETQLKNEIELADFKVQVPAGIRHCKLIVRNRGVNEYRDAFDPEPLNMVLAFDNLEVRPGEISRLDVGITRGKMKMGKARFYRIE